MTNTAHKHPKELQSAGHSFPHWNGSSCPLLGTDPTPGQAVESCKMKWRFQGVNITFPSFMDFPVQLYWFCMNIQSEMVLTPNEAIFLKTQEGSYQ